MYSWGSYFVHVPKVGSIRNFNLKDGENIRERLLAIGDGVFQGGFDALETAFAT